MDAHPSTSGVAGNLAAAQAVFSITVEGDLLPDSDGAPTSAEPLTDWRLVVAPALVLENLLPIRGTFMVWEQPQAGCPTRLACLPVCCCHVSHMPALLGILDNCCKQWRFTTVQVTEHW